MRRPQIILIGLAIISVSLGACRESEQNRALSYEKGVYGGPQDQKLNEKQLRELDVRIRSQGSI